MNNAALKQRVTEIAAELVQLNDEQERLRFTIAVKGEVLRNLRSLVADGDPELLLPPPAKAPASVLSNSLSAKTIEILKAAGGTMRVRDIARKLKENGFSSTGKTSIQALINSAIRRRKDLFEKVGRGRYRLAKAS